MFNYLGKWIIYDKVITDDDAIYEEKIYTFDIQDKGEDVFLITKTIYNNKSSAYSEEIIPIKSFEAEKNLLNLTILESQSLFAQIQFFSNKLFRGIISDDSDFESFTRLLVGMKNSDSEEPIERSTILNRFCLSDFKNSFGFLKRISSAKLELRKIAETHILDPAIKISLKGDYKDFKSIVDELDGDFSSTQQVYSLQGQIYKENEA